jgi:glycosyltransferase involved in cell wall biosynthesis
MSGVTDHFVMVSDADRQRAAALGLVPLDRSRVIRAGIDLARFRCGVDGWAIREAYGIPAAVPLVTQVGNFKPQKAPLDFVRVAEQVAGADPTAWFLMIGDGPLRGEAEARVHASGIGDRFVFGGWSDDIPGVLAATTVSVLTSRHEGLPCSVVESLAAGVPIVATAVDGTVEVVRPGENGFLAPAGDVRALAEGVVVLLSEPDRRRRFAHAAREGLDEFDRDLMVRKQEELYRWIGTTTRS